ncbi:alpha/beta fold hydrolase [Flavobacterium sp.]|uniref:alpha/beta hydrolase family protein n=1 Tax=Flavobacterium sp. TaxID=239 RepID=UPI00286E5149|nr:alpha/beta fold hydrolase [Flavobacterium sp.]
MKKTILLIIVLTTASTFAQDISGKWYGILKIPGMQLNITFNINKSENGYTSTMDSPDQKAFGIPTTSTSFENSILKIAIANARIEFEGILAKDSTINGNFKQAGQSIPLLLSKEKVQKEKIVRPQVPTKPYPYISEDITFENKQAGITLAGTLTLPKKEGKFPVVVLISGSSPQNRDEEILGHKPFLVLSDHLTRNGIAVLRYDDRGTGESKGDFKTGTSLDFSTDAQAAVNYLKTRTEINQNQIGLIGHSEGGLIAPMLAAKSKEIAFIVLLAGPGIAGDQILLLQQELIAKASGVPDTEIQKTKNANIDIFKIVKKSKKLEQLKTDLSIHLKQSLKENLTSVKPAGMSDDDFIKIQLNQIATPWMQYFIKYDPTQALQKVKCPVLALNGEKDLQVPSKENLVAIKNILTKSGNKKITTIEIPNLNHLFQECKTGSPNEYGSIEQTFSPIALQEISKWIALQVK